MIGSLHTISVSLVLFILFTLPLESTPTIGCFGFICSIHPLVSQQCCKTMNRCCGQYQSWLYPLVGTRDSLTEFVRVMHNLDRPRNRTQTTLATSSGVIDNLAVMLANDEKTNESIRNATHSI